MQPSIYVRLTAEFNAGRLRAIISSGQAVVLHRLAIMSKDGDWILREDEEATRHVLTALETHSARYRYGAPLETRWLKGGWSSHLEFADQGLRVRTDFVSRPPRLSPERLERLWKRAESSDPPIVPLADLADLKKTNREKDYAIIGELARRMDDPLETLLYSRSARDLLATAEAHPGLLGEAAGIRPLLTQLAGGRDALEVALDAERRQLMRANEERLRSYLRAATGWRARWSELEPGLRGVPLRQVHERLVAAAEGCLPEVPDGIPS